MGEEIPIVPEILWQVPILTCCISSNYMILHSELYSFSGHINCLLIFLISISFPSSERRKCPRYLYHEPEFKFPEPTNKKIKELISSMTKIFLNLFFIWNQGFCSWQFLMLHWEHQLGVSNDALGTEHFSYRYQKIYFFPDEPYAKRIWTP